MSVGTLSQCRGAALLTFVLLLCAVPGGSQPMASGLAWLTNRQQVDGSWESSQVRLALATTEAFRALQTLGGSPDAQFSALLRIVIDPVADTDDRARRIPLFSMERSGPMGVGRTIRIRPRWR